MTDQDHQTYQDQMTGRRSLRKAGIALVAAYALALQALLASFGVGATLVRHQAAAIAGVICSGGGVSSLPVPVAPVDHDTADCCIVCGAPTPGLLDHVSALNLATQHISSRWLAPLGAHHHGTAAWLPGGARAPPTA
jgi:hypothetical protein